MTERSSDGNNALVFAGQRCRLVIAVLDLTHRQKSASVVCKVLILEKWCWKKVPVAERLSALCSLINNY